MAASPLVPCYAFGREVIRHVSPASTGTDRKLPPLFESLVWLWARNRVTCESGEPWESRVLSTSGHRPRCPLERLSRLGCLTAASIPAHNRSRQPKKQRLFCLTKSARHAHKPSKRKAPMTISPVPQPWEIIDLAVSNAGRTARPGRIRRLANLYGYSVAYVSKWARPWKGDRDSGEASCIDRFLRLLPALYEMCPQSLALAIQLVELTYEEIMNTSDSPAQTNIELARELLQTVSYLLDPQSADTDTGELARAKSIIDRALAARRNPKGGLGRLKLSPVEYTNLARASRESIHA